MGKRILLVEAKDDEHVVRHLCRAHGIEVDDHFSIEPPKNYQGVDYLLDEVVPLRLKESDLQRLGIVVDADENAHSRWQQLRERLRKAGCPRVPDHPDEDGTILDVPNEFGDIRVGIWIMPNNQLPGMLENFLAFLVPEGDRLLLHVDRFLEGIPPEERLFSPIHEPKARIHSYLAVQEEPGKPLGLSITFRYLDPKREEANRFFQWIEKVLVIDGNKNRDT